MKTTSCDSLPSLRPGAPLAGPDPPPPPPPLLPSCPSSSTPSAPALAPPPAPAPTLEPLPPAQLAKSLARAPALLPTVPPAPPAAESVAAADGDDDDDDDASESGWSSREMVTLPVSRLHKTSHHEGRSAKAGLHTPAMKPSLRARGRERGQACTTGRGRESEGKREGRGDAHLLEVVEVGQVGVGKRARLDAGQDGAAPAHHGARGEHELGDAPGGLAVPEKDDAVPGEERVEQDDERGGARVPRGVQVRVEGRGRERGRRGEGLDELDERVLRAGGRASVGRPARAARWRAGGEGEEDARRQPHSGTSPSGSAPAGRSRCTQSWSRRSACPWASPPRLRLRRCRGRGGRAARSASPTTRRATTCCASPYCPAGSARGTAPARTRTRTRAQAARSRGRATTTSARRRRGC